MRTLRLRGDQQQRSPRHQRERSRGQGLVEFALVLPIALVLLVAVGDLARLYITMITVESAAREAADYGAYGSDNWDTANRGVTLDEMKMRACTASRHLTDYAYDDVLKTCTNPSVDIKLLLPDDTIAGPESDCYLADREGGPCRVQVDLEYQFDLMLPLALDVNGVRIGFPESVTFTRRSIFANSDFLSTPW